ncbi:MAG: RNA polymerase sigma factor [Gemmataceae bacterium]
MAKLAIRELLGYLRREMPSPGTDLISDSDLLTRFAATRDEAAFELLVRRHGPMVYGVARRILADSHIAEDVLQATFLALAQRAKALRRQTALPAWLYRVAVRIAHRAKPRPAPNASPAISHDDPHQVAERSELKRFVDAAVVRLPDKLQRAVVLCYLSGHTTDEAASLMDCPRGTVLSRLSIARDRLRIDLTRRGVVVPTATIATILASELESPALSSLLISLTLNVLRPAATLSPAVITLAQGIVIMSWSKFTVAALAVLFIGVVGIGLARPDPIPKEKHNAVAENPPPRESTREAKVKSAEQRLAVHLNNTASVRIDLKLKVIAAEQRVKNLQDGIRGLESTNGGSIRAAMLTFELDPKTGFQMFTNDAGYKAAVDAITKGEALLAEAQRKLLEVQEDLKTYDEERSVRTENLKRDVVRVYEGG